MDEARIENANSEVQYYSVDPTLMQELVYGSGNAIDWKHVVSKKPEANQLFKLRWEGEKDSEVVCARFDEDRDKIVLIRSHSAYGISPATTSRRWPSTR